ncbi:Tannase/feruloyl esterase [Penicillium italicum]|uniref:Carboxylic ester hydrolase n=1 Tax=Penicillium italicum TaxID=40296 RepID=A0A0A2KNV5_PENIT|nr:Tannase/feruloyl esterase [Penicillium italicum]
MMINYVENGIKPSCLSATVSSGTYEGETQMLCRWPTRPLWKSNSTFTCVDVRASIDSWTYSFPVFKVPGN